MARKNGNVVVASPAPEDDDRPEGADQPQQEGEEEEAEKEPEAITPAESDKIRKAVELVSSISISLPRMDLRQISIPVVGTAPLVVHAWSEKAVTMMRDRQQKKGPAPKTAKDPEADFQASKYISQEGWEGVPAAGFKAAMVNVCRLFGKSGLPMTVAKRTLFVAPEGYSTRGVGLTRIYGDCSMREDMVRLQTGVADIRYRAAYAPGWKANVLLRFNAALVSLDTLITLLEYAGMHDGICEWRPGSPESVTGSWGTFQVDAEAMNAAQ